MNAYFHASQRQTLDIVTCVESCSVCMSAGIQISFVLICFLVVEVIGGHICRVVCFWNVQMALNVVCEGHGSVAGCLV